MPSQEITIRDIALALTRLSKTPGIDALLDAAQMGDSSSSATLDQAAILRIAEEDRRRRELRKQILPKGCAGESCWLIMLSLYIDGRRQRRCYTSDAIVISGLPSTTALRKLQNLEKAGLVVSFATPHDRRRRAIELTAAGIAAVTKVVSHFA